MHDVIYKCSLIRNSGNNVLNKILQAALQDILATMAHDVMDAGMLEHSMEPADYQVQVGSECRTPEIWIHANPSIFDILISVATSYLM